MNLKISDEAPRACWKLLLNRANLRTGLYRLNTAAINAPKAPRVNSLWMIFCRPNNRSRAIATAPKMSMRGELIAAAATSSPLMDIFGAVAIALLLLLGRQKIIHNEFTLGAFGAFIAAVFSLYNPVRKFALFNNSFQQALGASSEIFKFMDSQDEIREKPGAQPLPPFSRSIRFEDVC